MASDRSRPYRLLTGFLGLLMRAFFRRVEVIGLEHIPKTGGGIVVSWHPNGLVDPGLILTRLPRAVVFGARHGLFNWPVLGALLRALGTVPIYRAVDMKGGADARREANAKSLEALSQQVAQGAFSALFPEGVSHDQPHLAKLKSGVARLYYHARARTPDAQVPPVIIPVGLHYDKKRVFRSRALVWFHAPMQLPAELDVTPAEAEDEQAARARIHGLTQEIGRVLREVVHATDDWQTHYTLHRARSLIRAERAKRGGARSRKPLLADRTLGFARMHAAYNARLDSHPERVAELRAHVEEYDETLRALGVQDHELDAPPKHSSVTRATLLVGQVILVFVLLPPLLVFGYVINGLTAAGVLALSKLGASKKKDVATIKILTGGLLFPLTWGLAAMLGVFAHRQLHSLFPQIPDRPVFAAVSMVLLAIIGGLVALRYLHLARSTIAAVKVRLTRARRKTHIAQALVERRELYDALLEMAEGLELPGAVESDGTLSHG